MQLCCYTDTHIHIHTTHIYTNTAHTITYTHMYVHTYKHTHTYILYTNTHHTHTHTRTYVHTRTHIPTHRTYLLNATSKEDRNEWIEAISKATPQSKNSPRAARKDVKQRTNPEPKKEELPHPKYTERQTTANEAALLSTEDQSENDKV